MPQFKKHKSLNRPEVGLVNSAVCEARVAIKSSVKEAFEKEWQLHSRELKCVLCNASPSTIAMAETKWWGECASNAGKSIVLCPNCLNTKWTLYHPANFKIARPIFPDDHSFAQMQWVINGKNMTTLKITDRLASPDVPKICPTALVYEMEDISNITELSLADIDLLQLAKHEGTAAESEWNDIVLKKLQDTQVDLLNKISCGKEITNPTGMPARPRTVCPVGTSSNLRALVENIYNKYCSQHVGISPDDQPF